MRDDLAARLKEFKRCCYFAIDMADVDALVTDLVAEVERLEAALPKRVIDVDGKCICQKCGKKWMGGFVDSRAWCGECSGV